MATPATFPQANLLLKRPAELKEEECSSLAVHITAETPPRFISCWQPSADDLERLVRGASIWLHVIGAAHPPVAITTEDPFSDGGGAEQ